MLQIIYLLVDFTHVMEKRSIPVCFTTEQYDAIKVYAKTNGMLNASQALEKMLNDR